MEQVPASAFFLLLGNLTHRCNLVIDEILFGIDVIEFLVDGITMYVVAISFANRACNLCGTAAGGAADSSVTSAIAAGLIISYVHITVNRFPVPVRVNFVGCMLVLLTGCPFPWHTLHCLVPLPPQVGQGTFPDPPHLPQVST